MGKVTSRLAALAMGGVLAGALSLALPHNPLEDLLLFPAVRAFRWIWPETQTLLDRQAPERNQRVKAELVGLSDHPWAGVYRTKEWWLITLTIAPQSGFTLYEDSGCGNCSGWRGMGRVLSSEGATLKLEIGHGIELVPETWYGLDPTLHFVRWGDLLFAVPAWWMELFCAQVSDGHSFPRFPFRYIGVDQDFDVEAAVRPEEKAARPRAIRGPAFWAGSSTRADQMTALATLPRTSTRLNQLVAKPNAAMDDQHRPSWRSLVARQGVHEAAACAIQAALLNLHHGRASPSTLGSFAVIKRTRGGRFQARKSRKEIRVQHTKARPFDGGDHCIVPSCLY